ARTDEVGQHLALLGEHDGAFGDAQFEGFARGAVAVAALALFAVTRTGVRAEVKVEKGVHAGVDGEEDVAALTAVAAVGSAERLELLPVHGGTAIAAGTRGEMDHRPVDESGCHGVPSCTDDAYGARRRTTTHAGRARLGTGPAPRRSYWWCWSGRSALDRNHVDHLAATLHAELDRARGQSEQRVVTATADVVARVELGAALPDEDLARLHDLTTEPLHTE